MNKLKYSKCGDYFIPEIVLSEQATKPLGNYGRLRQTYLQEHRQALFNHLVLSEKLFPPPKRSGRASTAPTWYHDSEDDESRRDNRTAQSHRANEMGRLDKYSQSTGGGNHFYRIDL